MIVGNYCLSKGLVRQVGPPSQPMQSSSPLKTLTSISEFIRAVFVSGRLFNIIHFPGDIVRILVLKVLLDKNSSSGALITVPTF